MAKGRTRHRARTVSLIVENVGDLGKNMIVEELIDQCDDVGVRLNLLAGRFWADGDECLGFAAFEANMSLGCASLG